METTKAPYLPEEIELDAPEPAMAETADSRPTIATASRRPIGTLEIDPRFRPPIWRLQSLKHGCYFLQWRPQGFSFVRHNGTMRIERHGSGVTASGDLYSHNSFRFIRWPSFQMVPNPDPSPSAGIPIYRRANYRYYLRVTQVLEWFTINGTFTMKFERRSFNAGSNSWTNDGIYTAQMTFKTPPAGYPSGAVYLEGAVTDPSGAAAGTIVMGWVSDYLRKATLEIDRVSASETPLNNGSGRDWRDIFDEVGWDMTVDISDSNVSEPSGQGWSNAEMHAGMLSRRDSSDLDTEWRYHLLCVRRIDVTSRGIMYDNGGTDSNNIPREGAAIASHWTIPNSNPWGTVKGQRFGAATAPYFRTAVHEIGHAMGLYHNTADNGFMNTTGTIAGNPRTFPANVQWTFNAADAKRLRHMPDPWVRPGMIPFGQPYGSTPISPTDMMDMDEALSLRVEPLLDAVPIGAPVRVRVTLTNTTDTPIVVPDDVSLKSEHIGGTVTDPAGVERTFRSVIRCIEDHGHETLKPGESMEADMTLLRGAEGALFPMAGLHRIQVNLAWEYGGVPVKVTGLAPIMVNPPVDESHSKAAVRVLSSADLLLTLAIGGDHLDDGVDALQTAMADKTLAPHFAVVEAKRLGRRFGKRKADPKAAMASCSADTVMSPGEARSLAEIAGEADDADLKALKKVASGILGAMKKLADGDRKVANLLKKIGA